MTALLKSEERKPKRRLPLRIFCPGCGAKEQVRRELKGRWFRCKGCGVPVRARDTPAREGRSAAIKTRGLAYEEHWLGLSFWFLLNGGVGLIACVAYGATKSSFRFDDLVLLFPLLLYALLVWIGCLLWQCKPLGRMLAAGWTCLGTLGYLYLSLIGGLSVLGVSITLPTLTWYAASLWILADQRSAWICTPRYQAATKQLTHLQPKPWRSHLFFLPLVQLTVLALAYCFC